MFKVNNRGTKERGHWCQSNVFIVNFTKNSLVANLSPCVFIVNFWKYFKPSSTVSAADFEQACVYWILTFTINNAENCFLHIYNRAQKTLFIRINKSCKTNFQIEKFSNVQSNFVCFILIACLKYIMGGVRQ